MVAGESRMAAGRKGGARGGLGLTSGEEKPPHIQRPN